MSALNAADLVLCGVPFAHVPLLERLAPARDAGFAGISVGPPDIWALEAAGVSAREIAARVADHGLVIAEMDCIGCWLPSQHAFDGAGAFVLVLKSLTPERVIETAARVGARSVSVVEMFGVRVDLEEAAESFARVCDVSADYGLRAHIEWLPWGGVPDLMSAWSVVQAAGRANGGLTVDSWHFFRGGSTLAQLRAIPGARVFAVQISDAPARAQADLATETMSARLLPGEGEFELVGLIRMLDEIGSTAPIGVEVFNAEVREHPIRAVAHTWARSTRAVLDQARSRA